MRIDLILPQFVLLDVIYVLAACMQTIHVPLVVSWRMSYSRVAVCIYEASLVVHLAIVADIILCSTGNRLLAPPFAIAHALAGVLWFNLLLVVFGMGLAVRYRRPCMIPELALIAASTPPVVNVLGPMWHAVVVIEGAFFFFRSIAALLLDARHRQEDVTALSTIETINVIPVGILYLDLRGRPLLMNRCMRTNLIDLHLPTDLRDMSGTWSELRRLGAKDSDEGGKGRRLDLERFGDARSVVEVSPSEIRLFVRDNLIISGRPFERIIGLDVTEYAHAYDRLAHANHLLELAAKELRTQIEEVKKVADNAAYLRMRARVHDVIGQRLSIMHRYLEEGRLDDESLEQIEPLLRSIAIDLHGKDGDGARDSAEELGDIVHAFGLVGVHIDVDGELPTDVRAAAAFLQIVREASTNATKHAQAHQINVRLWEEGAESWRTARMTISNDGAPVPASIREGTGIPGMRQVAQDLGGSLEVNAGPPFTLTVSIPLSSDITAQRRSS